MLSEESIKKMKDRLQDLISYYDDYAKDEDDNIIDEECYENANAIDNAFYYIEQLEAKANKYDSLVKKIKDRILKIEENKIDLKLEQEYKECDYEIELMILQELLKEAKNEQSR